MLAKECCPRYKVTKSLELFKTKFEKTWLITICQWLRRPALDEVKKTVHGITGLEVRDITAK